MCFTLTSNSTMLCQSATIHPIQIPILFPPYFPIHRRPRLGPVQSQLFFSLETGLPSTTLLRNFESPHVYVSIRDGLLFSLVRITRWRCPRTSSPYLLHSPYLRRNTFTLRTRTSVVWLPRANTEVNIYLLSFYLLYWFTCSYSPIYKRLNGVVWLFL